MLPASDFFAALRWWAILLLLSAAVWPLTFRLFRSLPDRGFAFGRMVGLLAISYLFWLAGSLGFLSNSQGSILLALLSVAGLGYWLYRRPSLDDGQTALGWLAANRRYVLTAELLFAVIFALWVWVRAQNPAITATEKPMEFAFLDSMGRSESFPPLDPWLSGFSISYYYFGYVMTSVIGRLALVPEPVGFNLAIAWLTAGTALGAFGLVYNLIVVAERARETVEAAADKLRANAVLLGLVAAMALPLAGNLEIVLEVLYANGVGSAEFWQALDIRDLNGQPGLADPPRYETSQWWWWRSSRVINEYHLSGRNEEGLSPIAEFPAFSFNLGDLHPHVLALPFAFLSLATALLWWLRQGTALLPGDWWRSPGELGQNLSAISSQDRLLWGFSTLVLGGLSFLNTWDVLIHLFIFVGAYVSARWRREGGWRGSLLGDGLTLALLLVLPAFLLYLPFYLGFRSQAGPPFILPMTMRPTRLAHFLVIFGMPLLSITTLLVVVTFARWRTSIDWPNWRRSLLLVAALVVGLFALMLLLGWIIASSPEGAPVIQNLANELQEPLPVLPNDASTGFRIRWGAAAVFWLVPTFVKARLNYPGVTLLLGGLLSLVLVLFSRRLNRPVEEIDEAAAEAETAAEEKPQWSPSSNNSPVTALPFVLLLIATGLLLTLGPEFVYLKDVFGQRLNTIFKFYFQSWVLFGSTAVFGLYYLLRHFRLPGMVVTAGYGVLLAVSLLFPFYAVQSRAAEYRGPATSENRLPPTLNGLAHVQRFNPDEYEAIMWLRENIDGSPVILEAIGGQYSGFARISAATGLPTVLGWAGHEYQWRGSTPEPGEREPVVTAIYDNINWDGTAERLNRYGVDYVYFGGLERSTYNPLVAEKFDQNLDVAFRNNSVTIYRWQPEE